MTSRDASGEPTHWTWRRLVVAIARWVLMLVGAMTLMVVLGLAALILHAFSGRSPPGVVSSQKPEAMYLLGVPGLEDAKVERVEQQVTLERLQQGHRFDAMALRVSGLARDRFDCPRSGCVADRKRWYRGDQLPPFGTVLFDTLYRQSEWEGAPWLPRSADLASGAFYVHVRQITFDGFAPSSIDLVIANPSTGTVYMINTLQ